MKPTIALFLYDPKCSVQSGNGVIKALQSDYNFKIFSINPLEDNFFDDVDMIVVPGGFGDASTFDRAFKHIKDRVKSFVQNGGKYLGICMGAYWAGKHYFDILDSVDAVQYLAQPNTDTRRPHAKNISITWQGNPMNMFWYDGCALVGNTNKFTTIATYTNGDAMAIVQNNIGLIGCHPESEQFWYDSYTWMKGKYHNGQHHQLLLDFANQLNTGCLKNSY
jgi:glutamine amidotransferase PdxT